MTDRHYQGHSSEHPALQQHSIGGIYPLLVVGYDNGRGVRYTVENIERGLVAATLPDENGVQVIRQWDYVPYAEDFARHEIGRSDVAWLETRPVFSKDPATPWILVPKG